MEFSDLSPELKEKARACETVDEVLALVKEEGIELSDDELENVSGGLQWLSTDHCPCDSDDFDSVVD